MNWDAVSAISEVIGAAAVVASLVFVGVQLRSNTKVLKLTFTDSSVHRFKESVIRLAESEQLSELLLRGVPDPEMLDGQDSYRFSLMIQAYILEYSNFYMHYKAGALDKQTFESLDSQMRNFCNAPGLKAYWERSGNNYPAEFREYMNNEVLGNFDPNWALPGSPSKDTPNKSVESDT
jgi:hypothetical protein